VPITITAPKNETNTPRRQLTATDKDLHRQVIQIAARFATNERQQHAGTLTQEDFNLERNRINAALLELIAQLPEPSVGTANMENTHNAGGKVIIQNAEKIYNIDHIDNAHFS
jgi:hypothetical protein